MKIETNLARVGRSTAMVRIPRIWLTDVENRTIAGNGKIPVIMEMENDQITIKRKV